MTSYIPSFISRRFSRPTADSEAPTHLHIPDAINNSIAFEDVDDEEIQRGGSNGEHISRAQQQNDALERVLAGTDSDFDVLSPMSISTPTEEDLRQIDQNRLAQAPVSNTTEDGTRNRGSTDPLPRRRGIRASGEDLRRGSWQARFRNSNNAVLASAIQNAANPRAGAAGFVDDPSRGRSVRASISSNMSPSSSGPGTPDVENKGPLMLPEDDGMRVTRGKIQAVQAMDVSADEKSRLMHVLMTERYTSHHVKSHREMMRDAAMARSVSPARASLRSVRSHDAPLTPKSELSATMEGVVGPNGEVLPSPSTSVFTTTSDIDYCVTSDDLEPTYYSKTTETQSKAQTAESSATPLGDEDLLGPEDEEDRPLGCAHYMRNVKLQCHACLAWYTCRFCHDEIEEHKLERRKTRNMLCMLCGTAQPAAHHCQTCGEEAASYYCDVCKLWDNDPQKSIYHCEDCGICRVGQGVGKDFFHCKVCDVCMEMSIRDKHICIERSVDCDCPICGEYMFTSPQTVIFLRNCGHSIHDTCYKKHLENSYKCPICAKSVMPMDISFRQLDRAIALQPMPADFRDTKALIICNDCRGKSSVAYHWLGLKCGECDSYNTTQLQLIGPNDTDPSTDLNQNNGNGNGDGGGSGSGDLRSGTATPRLLSDSFHTARGRSESGLQVLGRSRRPTSTSAIQDLRTPLGNDYFYPITNGGRSLSAMGIDRARTGSEWIGSAQNTASMDVDNDEDEMDFWGGDASPRLLSPSRGGAQELVDDDSESEDEIMEDTDEDDGDDDEGMMDDLDVFGHR